MLKSNYTDNCIWQVLPYFAYDLLFVLCNIVVWSYSKWGVHLGY